MHSINTMFANSAPKISTDELRNEVRKEYTNVALDPNKGYHFHTGREALRRIGYNETLYETLQRTTLPHLLVLEIHLCWVLLTRGRLWLTSALVRGLIL